MKLLVIEDEIELSKSICAYLERDCNKRFTVEIRIAIYTKICLISN
ncbi:MAG: hypothetical protein M3R50_07325 [Bacteroidota bacterium]|nr:hypothetical protein [Bacteroidota bacterium]